MPRRNLGLAIGDAPNQARPDALVSDVWQFNHPRNIITLHPFTITDSGTVTKAIASVGGRPAFSMVPTTSTATDGTNACYGVAGHILQQGKQIRIFGSFYGADIVNQEFFFGMAVVGTGLIATPATNFVGFRKLTTVAQPSFVCRKATGTAQDTVIPVPAATLANNTWYDFEIVVVSDPTVAGQATASVYLGASVAGNTGLPMVAQNIPIASQFPDTVALALAFAYRQGSTGNTLFYVGHVGVELEA